MFDRASASPPPPQPVCHKKNMTFIITLARFARDTSHCHGNAYGTRRIVTVRRRDAHGHRKRLNQTVAVPKRNWPSTERNERTSVVCSPLGGVRERRPPRCTRYMIRVNGDGGREEIAHFDEDLVVRPTDQSMNDSALNVGRSYFRDGPPRVRPQSAAGQN